MKSNCGKDQINALGKNQEYSQNEELEKMLAKAREVEKENSLYFAGCCGS